MSSEHTRHRLNRKGRSTSAISVPKGYRRLDDEQHSNTGRVTLFIDCGCLSGRHVDPHRHTLDILVQRRPFQLKAARSIFCVSGLGTESSDGRCNTLRSTHVAHGESWRRCVTYLSDTPHLFAPSHYTIPIFYHLATTLKLRADNQIP